MIDEALTWYDKTADRGGGFDICTGPHVCDVAVVGGGLAGLTTALELQRLGQSVVLLEAEKIAGGASGRNGGFVSNGFAESWTAIIARVGLAAAQNLHALSKQGTEFVRATIAAHDPAIKMGDGWMVVQRHPDSGSLKAYGQALARDFGEQISYLDRVELRKHLDSASYHAALASGHAFHIHPLRYAVLLARLATGAGARIFENSKVLQIDKSNGIFKLATAQAQIRARDVVFCVSSLDRHIHRPTGRAVLPVATYIAVTEPLRQTAIQTRAAIADTRRAGDYYRLIDEGRILWGGKITTRISKPSGLAEEMKRQMLAVYPQLGNPRIDYAWAGLMGYALHKMPLIGRDRHGPWYATAFGGHGLNTTAMAGLLLAQAIARGDDTYQQFAPYGPRYAFGLLGRAGVQASYWAMQVLDRLDEWRGS
jgi:gamma-glutamylputrescine oxidase